MGALMAEETTGPARIDRGYYIKLGRAGEWEIDAISHSRLRFGWSTTPLHDIITGEWEVINQRIKTHHPTGNAATVD